jgi:hypothetical protein
VRDLVTTCAELVGFACLAAAGFTVSLTVGLVVAGVSLVVVGYLAGRR